MMRLLCSHLPRIPLLSWYCAVIVSSPILATSIAVGESFHVSPNGNDLHGGTAEAPVASFERALELARQTTGADEIRLAANSRIQLRAPVQLDVRDQGLRVVSEGNAVLSGGLPVVGWEVVDDGTWRAACPTKMRPRELFVNGRRATSARWPNSGWLRIVAALPDRRSGFMFERGDLPADLRADETLELVFLHDWSVSRVPVASIDRESQVLKTAFPIGSYAPHYAIDHFEKNPRYALEGSLQLLDAPGEWSYADGELHYRPLPGETPEDVQVIVPNLPRLLTIAGSPQESVVDIQFSGVAFAHCHFSYPPQGYVEGQATMHDRRDGSQQNDRVFVPAAVRIENSKQIRFEDCRFSQLGGSGLWIGQGAVDCRVVKCEFSDISGNGINIGEANTENVATRIHVDECLVHHCGAQFFGAVGVWIAMAEECHVTRCEIRDLPYTGISVGWRWNPTPSPCRGHQIVDNHIHHVMQILSDGGGIYTLGRQPGTRLANNRIHDVPLNAGRAQSNGIFMDEGTTELLVEENTIYNIAKSPIRFHKAGENLIRSNTLGISDDATSFTFNSTDPAVIRFEQNEEHSNAEVATMK